MNALLGGIIGGALEQGGKAAYKSFAEDAELERKMTLEDHRSKIEEDRAMRLDAIKAKRDLETEVRGRGYKDIDRKADATVQTERDTSLAGLQRETQRQADERRATEAGLDRTSREGISAAGNATQLKAAGISAAATRDANSKPTYQPQDDGTTLGVRPDGTSFTVMKTDKDGKLVPAVGIKDTSARTIEAVRLIQTEIRGLDETNPASAARATALRAEANALLGFGPKGGAAEPPKRTPTSEQIRELQRKVVKNPNEAVTFEQAFGKEHLTAAMSGVKKDGDGAPPPIIGNSPEYEAAVAARLAERQGRAPANPALEKENAAAAAQIQAKRESEAQAAAKVKELKDRMLTVSSMSPAEAAKMLAEDGPRLSVNERAKLQKQANR